MSDHKYSKFPDSLKKAEKSFNNRMLLRLARGNKFLVLKTVGTIRRERLQKDYDYCLQTIEAGIRILINMSTVFFPVQQGTYCGKLITDNITLTEI